MNSEAEMEEVEAVLERIWDLHDKVSDAIHAISRAYFLNAIPMASPDGKRHPPPCAAAQGGDDGRSGYVFVKDFRADDDENAAAMAEARSLNAIRSALENLEDQLEFFHAVQSQQRVERNVALARLEQSRIFLAMTLADHQGKKYTVIDEALAFVGGVHDTGRFVAPANLYEMPRAHSPADLEGQEHNRSNILMQMLISSFQLVKGSFKMERVGGVLGNAALFAVSVLALVQLHQVAMKRETLRSQHEKSYAKRNEKLLSEPEMSSLCIQLKHFDVFSARG